MRSMSDGTLFRAFAYACVGALCCAGSAGSDIVKKLYVSPSFYHYKVTHMPDLDQIRYGLPADGGMYCAPTSTLNLFCYAANHGLPMVYPGPANWQSQTKYADATAAISLFGSLMATDPIEGTPLVTWEIGAQVACSGLSEGAVTRQFFCNSNDYTVRMHRIAQLCSTGAVASICYGRYFNSSFSTLYQTYTLGDWQGGHAVTLVEAYRLGTGADDAYIRVRDPADSEYPFSQSTFVTREIDSDEVLVRRPGEPNIGRSMTALYFDPGSAYLRLVYGFMVIRPASFLKFSSSGSALQVALDSIGGFGGAPAPVTLETTPTSVLDVSFDSDSIDALVLASYPGAVPIYRLTRVDMVSGAQTTVASSTNFKRFVTGRDGQIYIHDGTTIRCLRADGTEVSSTTAVASPAAMAFDDANDRLVVLSLTNRRLTRLSSTLGVVSSVAIPTAIPVSGENSVCVNTDDGSVFFVTDGNSSLHRLDASWASGGFSSIAVPGVSAPRSITAGDGGRLFVTTSGVVRALVRTKTGGWVQDTASPFHLRAGGSRISMMRSRTNYDPAQHGGAAWRELRLDEEPPIGVEVPDCLADVDGDGVVGAVDLARFLANWGGTDWNYDFNADDAVNAQDLGVLLATWGPCP